MTSIPYQTIIQSPFGKIGFNFRDNTLTHLDWLPAESQIKRSKAPGEKDIVMQLEAYFKNPRHQFQIDLAPEGSVFQQKVWQAIRDIPSGSIMTYGQLAKHLNSSPRAVGQACRRNPVVIITPCHRVVGATGLGGYTGATKGPQFETKRMLLQHEGQGKDIATVLPL